MICLHSDDRKHFVYNDFQVHAALCQDCGQGSGSLLHGPQARLPKSCQGRADGKSGFCLQCKHFVYICRDYRPACWWTTSSKPGFSWRRLTNQWVGKSSRRTLLLFWTSCNPSSTLSLTSWPGSLLPASTEGEWWVITNHIVITNWSLFLLGSTCRWWRWASCSTKSKEADRDKSYPNQKPRLLLTPSSSPSWTCWTVIITLITWNHQQVITLHLHFAGSLSMYAQICDKSVLKRLLKELWKIVIRSLERNIVLPPVTDRAVSADLFAWVYTLFTFGLHRPLWRASSATMPRTLWARQRRWRMLRASLKGLSAGNRTSKQY